MGRTSIPTANAAKAIGEGALPSRVRGILLRLSLGAISLAFATSAANAQSTGADTWSWWLGRMEYSEAFVRCRAFWL